MTSTLSNKLSLRSGLRMLVVNAPAGYLDSLGKLPEAAQVREHPDGQYDFVQLFVKDSSQFHTLSPIALGAVTYDGLFWLCYPKKSAKVRSDLSRDVVWELMQGSGLRLVTQISIDETWSALRFQPAERVGR